MIDSNCFNNTALGLKDCLEALKDGKTLKYDDYLSCEALFTYFLDFCHKHGIVECGYDELFERLGEYFKTIKYNQS
jgi:hypothetical protein